MRATGRELFTCGFGFCQWCKAWILGSERSSLRTFAPCHLLPPPPHGQVTTRAADLSPDDFAGCNWVFLSAYALYSEGLLQRAAELAVQVGRGRPVRVRQCLSLGCGAGGEAGAAVGCCSGQPSWRFRWGGELGVRCVS